MDDTNRPTAASPDERLNGRGTAMRQPDIERIVSRLGPRAVYGDPVERGEMTVIPVAEVRFGFGFGSGQSEEARRAAGPEHHQGQGGGGGRGSCREASSRSAPTGCAFDRSSTSTV